MKLKHPNGGTVDARPDSVDIYLSQGWEKATTKKTTAAPRASDKGGNQPQTTTEKEQG
ncbi:MAG: hypothetical protein H0X12_11165 [Nocardioides sp.]|nr:hypothetical protein [Nocardioides sp.]